MKDIFIGGIPAAGKSVLAEAIAQKTGSHIFSVDDWREYIDYDSDLRDWVDFFGEKNEREYWEKTSCEEHWDNLVQQSEAFWIGGLEKAIKDRTKEGSTFVFEGVNLLPHLLKDIPELKGIFLINDSVEEIFRRNKKDPRWGKTEELQRKEAEVFVECEGTLYKKEAEKYGYKTFFDTRKAEKEAIDLIYN